MLLNMGGNLNLMSLLKGLNGFIVVLELPQLLLEFFTAALKLFLDLHNVIFHV